MDIAFILSEIIVVAAYVTLGVTYFVKTKKGILVYLSLAGVFFLTHYALLGAWTGVVVNIVCLLRQLWFYFDDKYNKTKDYLSLFVCIALIVGCSAVTYATPWDLCGIFAGVITTWGVWQKNVQTYRYSMVINSLCWITYNIYLGSVFAVVGELSLLVANVVAITIFNVNWFTQHKFEKTFDEVLQEAEIQDLIIEEKVEKSRKVSKNVEKSTKQYKNVEKSRKM